MNFCRKIVKYSIVTYFILIGIILSLTIFSIQLQEKYNTKFEDFIVFGIPMIIMLTLIFTLSNKLSKWINLQFILFTPLVAFLSYLGLTFIVYISNNDWVNYSILYENKSNRTETINEQLLDVGALGYGGKRLVKVKPMLGIFEKVTIIDTTEINNHEWTLVNREGDLKMP